MVLLDSTCQWSSRTVRRSLSLRSAHASLSFRQNTGAFGARCPVHPAAGRRLCAPAAAADACTHYLSADLRCVPSYVCSSALCFEAAMLAASFSRRTTGFAGLPGGLTHVVIALACKHTWPCSSVHMTLSLSLSIFLCMYSTSFATPVSMLPPTCSAMWGSRGHA